MKWPKLILINMSTILSPVTGKHATKKEIEIPVSVIKERYNAININVDRFFKNLQSVEIRKCEATGYRFYFPFGIFGDDLFYQELQSGCETYYIERWEHVMTLNLLQETDKVLEVGSGSGYFLQLLKQKNISAVGLELNQKAVKEANEKGLTLKNQLLEEFASGQEKQFEAVCSFQVLEHISDIKSYFDYTIKTLKKGGKIIIGVPNNNPYIFKHDVLHTLNLPPHHAGLWDKNSFKKLEQFFPIKLKHIYLEPLIDYKEWYQTQVKYYKNKNKLFGSILGAVPRPLYKAVLKLLKNKIEGRNILAVFEKL
jgi:2-polyprenyl-3-methyl-5-hydroxy-6-metoxy-1,4-benzoquinol methylase